MTSFVKNVVVVLVLEMTARVRWGFIMKGKLKEFAFFLFRCALAGLVILVCTILIYSVVYALVALIGKAPMEGYSFWYQYVQAGFWIGFFAMVKDLKKCWR